MAHHKRNAWQHVKPGTTIEMDKPVLREGARVIFGKSLRGRIDGIAGRCHFWVTLDIGERIAVTPANLEVIS